MGSRTETGLSRLVISSGLAWRHNLGRLLCALLTVTTGYVVFMRLIRNMPQAKALASLKAGSERLRGPPNRLAQSWSIALLRRALQRVYDLLRSADQTGRERGIARRNLSADFVL